MSAIKEPKSGIPGPQAALFDALVFDEARPNGSFPESPILGILRHDDAESPVVENHPQLNPNPHGASAMFPFGRFDDGSLERRLNQEQRGLGRLVLGRRNYCDADPDWNNHPDLESEIKKLLDFSNSLLT